MRIIIMGLIFLFLIVPQLFAGWGFGGSKPAKTVIRTVKVEKEIPVKIADKIEVIHKGGGWYELKAINSDSEVMEFSESTTNTFKIILKTVVAETFPL